jgi:hypothetical protein
MSRSRADELRERRVGEQHVPFASAIATATLRASTMRLKSSIGMGALARLAELAHDAEQVARGRMQRGLAPLHGGQDPGPRSSCRARRRTGRRR